MISIDRNAQWKTQKGKCAICGRAMEQKGSEINRTKASDGYTVENTRLVHHECHVAEQAKKRLTDATLEDEAAH